MNPVRLKKKEHKNILGRFFSIFLSMLIHCAIFIVFSYYCNKSINQEIKWESKSQTVKIFLNYNSTLKKDAPLSAEKTLMKDKKPNTNRSKSVPKKSMTNHTLEKPVSLNKHSDLNNTISLQGNTNSSLKTSNNNAKESQKESVTLVNPFGFLKLPKSFLGQNLFPKKYRAEFKFIKRNGKWIDFSFQGLKPIQEQLPYFDDIIQKAFENQINQIPKEQLIPWLEGLYESIENPPQTSLSDPIPDSVPVILEFHESN